MSRKVARNSIINLIDIKFYDFIVILQDSNINDNPIIDYIITIIYMEDIVLKSDLINR